MNVPRVPDTSPQTLLVFAALLESPDEWHYGYGLSRRTGLKSGTLYPVLIRLADRGWLETRWIDSVGPGRPRRHNYRLTTTGALGAAAALAAVVAAPPRGPLLRSSPGVVAG